MITTEHSGVIPWQPWSKKRPQISRGGRRTHQDPADASAEDRTRTHLREEMASGGMAALTENVRVRLLFFRQTAHVVDIDNLIKHFLDSANGVLFVDDRQVTAISAELHLDRDRPRTEWRVSFHVGATLLRDLG